MKITSVRTGLIVWAWSWLGAFAGPTMAAMCGMLKGKQWAGIRPRPRSTVR